MQSAFRTDPAPAASAETTAAQSDVSAAIRDIADDTGTLVVDLADVAGHIDDIDSGLRSQASTMDSLMAQVRSISDGNASVMAAVTTVTDATRIAHATVATGEAQIASAIRDVSGLIDCVTTFGTRTDGLSHALDQVSRVAADIYSIAA